MADAEALYLEAEQLKDAGEHEAAVAKLQEALAVDPSHSLSHLTLAVLYGKLNEHDKAIEHGQKACEIEPNDVFAFTAMSVTYKRAFDGTQNPEYIQLAEDAMAKARMLQSM